jgi:APA family basic amino acid/polyamine antiporter
LERCARVITAILSVALLGSASAMLLAGPRVFFAMAREGFFPASLAASSWRGTPELAILLQALWVSVVIVFFGAFEPVILYTSLAITLFTAMAAGAVIVLRRRCPGWGRFHAPGHAWIPVGFIAVSLWVVIYTAIEQPSEAVFGAATVAVGIPMYWICSRFRQRSGAREGIPRVDATV